MTRPARRLDQFRAAEDPRRSRKLAAGLFAAKIRNQRTILRCNWKTGEEDAREDVMTRLKRLAEAAPHAPDTLKPLGLEGEAVAVYFLHFNADIG